MLGEFIPPDNPAANSLVAHDFSKRPSHHTQKGRPKLTLEDPRVLPQNRSKTAPPAASPANKSTPQAVPVVIVAPGAAAALLESKNPITGVAGFRPICAVCLYYNKMPRTIPGSPFCTLWDNQTSLEDIRRHLRHVIDQAASISRSMGGRSSSLRMLQAAWCTWRPARSSTKRVVPSGFHQMWPWVNEKPSKSPSKNINYLGLEPFLTWPVLYKYEVLALKKKGALCRGLKRCNQERHNSTRDSATSRSSWPCRYKSLHDQLLSTPLGSPSD